MAWLDRIDERQARRLARTIQTSALDARHLAEDRVSQLAGQARAVAEPAIHQLADYARHEAPVLAKAAAKQATRLGRAAQADPITAVVGAVGVALLASLVFGRRRT